MTNEPPREARPQFRVPRQFHIIAGVAMAMWAFVAVSAARAQSATAAGRASAPTSIRMSDYFPVANLSLLYRTGDGRIYLRHVIEPSDPSIAILPQQPAGAVNYVLHDYFHSPTDNMTDAPIYGDTWHMRNMPNGEVSEIADSFAQTDANGKPVTCTSPCYGRIAVYKNQVIGHGKAGGDALGEPYVQNNIEMWYSPDGVSAPTYNSALGAWSSEQVVARLDTFTPAYGGSNGVFRRGGGQTYHNVIKVMFGHGTTSSSAKACPNQPANTPHVIGYSSFWQQLYLAPGVGWVQIENLFYEAFCDGTLTAADPASWTAYLDTVTSAPTCVSPAPEVVVNTCQQVGYPVGSVGSYVSTRQFDCSTGAYGAWTRRDGCR